MIRRLKAVAGMEMPMNITNDPNYQRLLMLASQIHNVKVEPTYREKLNQEIQDLILILAKQIKSKEKK